MCERCKLPELIPPVSEVRAALGRRARELARLRQLLRLAARAEREVAAPDRHPTPAQPEAAGEVARP